MIGDRNDMLARLRAVLPLRWFPDTTPVLDGLLSGLAGSWATLADLLAFVRAQTRLASAAGAFLDLAAGDYLGASLPRRAAEADDPYRARIQREITRGRGTRPALASVLTDLTGRVPEIVEFARPADTGAWGTMTGYGVAGRWGGLGLPFQCLVTAYRRQADGPLAGLAGWGSGAGGWGGGAIAYANAAQIVAPVADADIRAAIASVLPAAVTAWTRIED